MDILEFTLLGNTVKDWSLALFVVCFVLFLLQMSRNGAKSLIISLAKRISFENVHFVEEVLDHTKFYFLVTIAIFCTTLVLKLPKPTFILLQHITVLVVLFQVGIWLGCGVSYWVYATNKKSKESDPSRASGVEVIGFLLRLGLWSIVILLGLDNMGFNITALLAGLGVGGIAVALAVQNILGDLFASLTILLDKPFVIGDSITVGEFAGTIEQIGLKTTRLRSKFGEQVIFSNANLLQSRIQNYSAIQERRVVFTFGVVYETPSDKLRMIPEIVRQAVECQQSTRFERSHFKSFGDFSLIFETVYCVMDPDYKKYMDIQQNINLAIFDRLDKEKIVLAHTVTAEPVNKLSGS